MVFAPFTSNIINPHTSQVYSWISVDFLVDNRSGMSLSEGWGLYCGAGCAVTEVTLGFLSYGAGSLLAGENHHGNLCRTAVRSR